MSGRAFSFAYRDAVGAVWSSFPPIGLWRLIAFPSCCYCPRVGSLCPSPRVLRVSCACLALSSCVAVAASSSHRLSPRSLDTAGGEHGAVGACGVGWCSRVRSMCYHPGSFSGSWGVLLVLCPASSRSLASHGHIVLVCGRLLENFGAVSCLICGDVLVISPLSLLASSPHRSPLSCGSRMYSLFASVIGFAPPLVSNKTGSKTGRDFAPVLVVPSGM